MPKRSAEIDGHAARKPYKAVQHGKRADAIVKNMLLHSREGSGATGRSISTLSSRKGLNLCYHGARAEKQGFNIKLEKAFDPDAAKLIFSRRTLNMGSAEFVFQ